MFKFAAGMLTAWVWSRLGNDPTYLFLVGSVLAVMAGIMWVDELTDWRAPTLYLEPTEDGCDEA